jgi:thiol-disulfide isomerase/thioredoxin
MVSLQAALAALALSGVGQTVLLDFYSDTCGPCQAMNPTVQSLIDAGYPVQRVNVAQNGELAAKLGVTRWPCFVMIVNGRVVDREVGMTSRERLEQMCKAGVSTAPPSRPRRLFARDNTPSPPQPNPPLVSLPPVASTQPPADLKQPRSNDPWNPSVPPQPIPSQPIPASPGTFAVSDAALLAASVRLRIEDPDGRSCGSGTIIDGRNGEALVLTCGHIFRDSNGKGRITVELFGGGTTEPTQVEGRLISYNLEQDVGLVAIHAPGPVAVARLAPPDYQIGRNMPVASVGCNNGDPPTVRHSQVTSLDRFQGPPNVEVAGQPEQGRSGGGLFSAEGYVIGVCNNADPTDREGIFAAPASIYAELDRAQLAFAYKSPSGSLETTAPAMLPVSSPAAGAMSGSTDLAALGPPSSGGSMATLPAHERAFLEEIRRYEKEGADIVCIVHPRGKPNAKSEVLMLDHASPGCVRQLSADARRQDRRYETSLELPKPRKVILEWTKPPVAP